MFPSKFLLLVVTIPLWLSLSYFHFEAYGDDASGDVKCDPPCQQQSPPISGYPSYGAPPPPLPLPSLPPPSPPPSGYSIYGAPPPPHDRGQSKKCPPAAGVQCCTPPPPYYYSTYGPPTPYLYSPPYPYTYVPNGEGFVASTLLPIHVPFLMMMLILSSFIFLF